MTDAVRSPGRRAHGLLHRHDRRASAARRARSPASSGTTCPPTAASSARAAPTTTPASWRRDLAARALRRELAPSCRTSAGSTLRPRRPALGRRLRRLGVHVRRLQALHERRLPGRLPDRRADPHRVRHRRAPARRLQRLRLLHPGVPVRRRRPRPRRRPRRQVHALLRPPRGRARARLREGVPDRLDPVRPLRRARRASRARRVATLHERGVEGAYLYGAGDEPGEQLAGGLGAFFLLTEPPERYGLPGAGRLADPGERRARRRWPRSGAGLLAAAGVAARVRCRRRRLLSALHAASGSMTPARRPASPPASPARRRRERPRARNGRPAHRRAGGDGALVVPVRRRHRRTRGAMPTRATVARGRAARTRRRRCPSRPSRGR